MHCYQGREANQHQSSKKLNSFYEANDRRDLHRTPLGEHMIPSERSAVSIPRPPFTTSGACGASGSSRSQPAATLRPRGRGATENDAHLNSSYGHFGASGKHLPSCGGERPSSTSLAMSPTDPRQLFSSGEIEECDKYNPLVLHHAEIQSGLQHRETRVPLGKAHPSPRGDDNQVKFIHHGVAHSQEPRAHRHNLLCNGGLWEATGKSAVLKPKANSAASTTMSIALAHNIVSTSASSSDATSTFFSNASTTTAKDSNAYKDSKHEADCKRGSRRMSLPQPPPMDRNANRRMSHTVTSPPKLLDSLFQRVWNPQQTSPGTNPSPLALTDDDLETFGMTDSQLVKHRTKQDWAQGPELVSSSSSVPNRYPSATSFTGKSSPCLSSSRRDTYFAEGRQAHRWHERFVQQVTFSLDETHKSGLQAILVLRRLTNGLTSAKITPPPPGVDGGRFGYPHIPIPKISHRYPGASTTVIINGQTRLINKKTIPSVVIDWSDGVRDEFDPTGMSLEEILGRCHYSSDS